jgi:DUF4097 and DUF4098 domain-containing protein YvlB
MIKLTSILKKSAVLIFLAGILFISVFGCSLFTKRYEKKEVTEYKINTIGKKSLSIDNVNGTIRISKNTTDNLLKVKAEIIAYVSKKELNEPVESMKLKIDTTGSDISFNSEYYKEKKFFHFDIGRTDKIDYEIVIPSNLDISIDNTNGKIYIDDIDNSVKLNIVNGDIKLTNTTGNINVDVTNGKVNGDLDSSKGLNIKTVNGSITLNLGNLFSGNFKAECLNGKVVVKDLEFKKYEESKKTFEGRLGKSDVDVRLETVNGKIYLNKK